LLLLLVLSACLVHDTPADAARTASNASQARRAEAAAFWRDFRRATLSDDVARVMHLTKFPFTTTGELDDDPMAKHGRAAFPALFSRLLRQHERPSPGVSIPMRDLIRRTPVLGARHFNGEEEHFHVGALYFGREGGRWRLLQAYLAD
jgi:hypothetical protein